eukprot:Skav203654  [mRNA]  locus=scaffold2755:35547:39857:+ [translate_table: standard]
MWWSLPKSFDRYIQDVESSEKMSQQMLLNAQAGLLKATNTGDIDDLARRWTHIAEQSLFHSTVESDGQRLHLSKAHLGRAKGSIFKVQKKIVPVTRRVRDGDYQVMQSQCSVVQRQHTRQLHRLQSLVRQFKSAMKTMNPRAICQLQVLWNAIFGSQGFHRSFAGWIEHHLQYQVSHVLPALDIIVDIRDTFASWHHKNQQREWLAKTNFRKLELIQDLSQGGKILFQKVKSESPKPITHLAVDQTFSVLEVPWKKGGNSFLCGGPFDGIEQSSLISFQGQTAKVEQVASHKILLDRPLKLFSTASDDLVVKQKKYVADPDDMHCALFHAWNQFFQRDNANAAYEVDDSLRRSIQAIPRGQKLEMECITGAQLQNAFATTKIKSARGCDGFSSRDLIKLPLVLCEFLACVLTIVESNGTWPNIWVCAKTICLPKGQDVSSPLDIRPVTVMAKLYRAWGKIRGAQVALHLAASVPPEIGGPCKQVASDLIALRNSFKTESALICNKKICGIILDIIKCYNTVPRGPLLMLLEWLGIHPLILNAFKGMMIQMYRVFEIMQSCSSGQSTTTGIIEGCSVAVPSMLAIGILMYHTAMSAEPSCLCTFFADNWAFDAECPNVLKNAFGAVQSVSQLWKLRISPGKSWAWSTHSDFRKMIANIEVDGTRIPVVLHEKDLGIQQSYCRKKFLQSMRKRIEKTRSRLKIIKTAKIPRGCRKRVVVAAALSNMNYTNGFVSIGKAEYNALRSSCASAMSRSGAGSNPYLACNAVDMDVDPELRSTLHSFQLWRRFFKTFPSETQVFSHCCQKLSNVSSLHKKPGPMANFVHVLQKHGFTADFHALTVQLEGLCLPWTQVSVKTLKRIVHQTWIRLISHERISRNDYDILDFDTYANRKAFLKLDYHDRSLVEQFFTGRHFTNDMLAKFLPAVEPRCPLCGENDSREHRLFHCRALDKFRVRFRRIKFLQTQWKRGHWFFGLCPCVEDAHHAIAQWCERARLILRPLDSDTRAHIFVDGTAFFGDVQSLTISAASWIQSPFQEKAMIDMQREPVPGADQSSFAAEIFAILMVLNIFKVATIYTDCAAVFDFVTLLLDHVDGVFPKCALPFFGIPVAEHIARRRAGDIAIVKLKSHRTQESAISEYDSWCIWGNEQADIHAKEVCLTDRRMLYNKIARMYKKTLRYRSDIVELYQYIAVTGHFQLQTIKDQRVQDLVIVPFVPENISELRMPRRGRQVVPTLTRDHFLAFTWGSVYLWRIVSWLQCLRWGPTPQAGCDISLVELYIDFCLSTFSRAPVNVFTTAERQKFGYYNFALMDLEGRADAAIQTLAQQTETWTRSILWLRKHCPQKFIPANVISRSISLAKLGCSSWHKAFDKRPILSQGFRAAHILHEYFCSSRGTLRNFTRPLDLKFDRKPPDAPSWLLQPFTVRVALMRRSKSLFDELP